MKSLYYIIFLVLFSSVAHAETRVWTLKSGKTLEAEFISQIGGKVSLKTLKGKMFKLQGNELSADDMLYIELESPPDLDLSASRTTKQRIFPDALNDKQMPSTLYNNLIAVVKQKSTKPYNQELTLEFFVVGEERLGDKYVLLDYKKEIFHLKDGSDSVFKLPSKTINVTEFEMKGQSFGEVYDGYMIVVTDSRGEVIAHRSKVDFWFENVENLRTVPAGKCFDDTCERAWPTRPKHYY